MKKGITAKTAGKRANLLHSDRSPDRIFSTIIMVDTAIYNVYVVGIYTAIGKNSKQAV